MTPEKREGVTVGARLVDLDPQGLPWRLGLRPADVVTQVNGVELTSPEAVLDAYSKARNARTITLTVERAGRIIALRYRIVSPSGEQKDCR